MRRAALIFTTWAAFLGTAPQSSAADASVHFASDGVEFNAVASRTPRRDDTLVEVAFRSADESDVLKVRLLQHGPGNVTFRTVRFRGFPDPVVVVQSTWLRADGLGFDLVAVGVADGRLVKLFAFTKRDQGDGICLAPPDDGASPRVVLARWVEGDEGVMGWPKQFRVIEYAWTGESLSVERSRLTGGAHPSWEEALQSYSIPCLVDLLVSRK